MTQHRLDAGPDTVQWGLFDARIPPVLEIEAGDTVVVSTVSGGPDVLPPPSSTVSPALTAIHARLAPRQPGHICTGPVAVRGAKPGDVLEVAILSVEPGDDWGYTYCAPLKGALPDDYDERHLFHSTIDRAARTARLPWGLEVPLAPFFGVMAVAPPVAWGPLGTLPPRRNGGNLDNKELVAGTVLYLPVFVEGALFSVGDGHGRQGDGEVCVTAIETGLVGEFRLTPRPDMTLVWPMAETPTHLVTMAFDPDLDACVPIALRTMIEQVVTRTGLSSAQAYALCSLCADVRITQVVNGAKGVHVMLDKSFIVGPGAERA